MMVGRQHEDSGGVSLLKRLKEKEDALNVAKWNVTHLEAVQQEAPRKIQTDWYGAEHAYVDEDLEKERDRENKLKLEVEAIKEEIESSKASDSVGSTEVPKVDDVEVSEVVEKPKSRPRGMRTRLRRYFSKEETVTDGAEETTESDETQSKPKKKLGWRFGRSRSSSKQEDDTTGVEVEEEKVTSDVEGEEKNGEIVETSIKPKKKRGFLRLRSMSESKLEEEEEKVTSDVEESSGEVNLSENNQKKEAPWSWGRFFRPNKKRSKIGDAALVSEQPEEVKDKVLEIEEAVTEEVKADGFKATEIEQVEDDSVTMSTRIDNLEERVSAIENGLKPETKETEAERVEVTESEKVEDDTLAAEKWENHVGVTEDDLVEDGFPFIEEPKDEYGIPLRTEEREAALDLAAIEAGQAMKVFDEETKVRKEILQHYDDVAEEIKENKREIEEKEREIDWDEKGRSDSRLKSFLEEEAAKKALHEANNQSDDDDSEYTNQKSHRGVKDFLENPNSSQDKTTDDKEDGEKIVSEQNTTVEDDDVNLVDFLLQQINNGYFTKQGNKSSELGGGITVESKDEDKHKDLATVTAENYEKDDFAQFEKLPVPEREKLRDEAIPKEVATLTDIENGILNMDDEAKSVPEKETEKELDPLVLPTDTDVISGTKEEQVKQKELNEDEDHVEETLVVEVDSSDDEIETNGEAVRPPETETVVNNEPTLIRRAVDGVVSLCRPSNATAVKESGDDKSATSRREKLSLNTSNNVKSYRRVEHKRRAKISRGNEFILDDELISEVGLTIWRVHKRRNKIGVYKVPLQHYGEFYSGDSYVILNTYAQNKEGKFEYDLHYDVHFWLGSESTQHEEALAILKSVQLDNFLNHAAAQHREVEFYESPKFQSYFTSTGIKHLKGGKKSGPRYLDDFEPVMYMVKQRNRACHYYQVQPKVENMNQGDVFVLDLGAKVFTWYGESASPFEKYQGCALANTIVTSRKGRSSKCTVTDDDFWNTLGGKEQDVQEAVSDNVGDEFYAGLNVLNINEDSYAPEKTEMFRITDASGEVELVQVEGVSADNLTTDDVYLISSNVGVWIWHGLKASKQESASAFGIAKGFIKEQGYSEYLPITVMREGQLDSLFTSVLHVDDNESVF